MPTGTDKKTVQQRLRELQAELTVPKKQEGRFGKHRNVEDILTAVKPLLTKHELTLTLGSELVSTDHGRHYIKARAIIMDDQGNDIGVSAYAWEGEISRGLDAPQVTGAATSYARKYALGGLLAIDDTKDPDSHKEPAADPPSAARSTTPASPVRTADTAPAIKHAEPTPKQLDMILTLKSERFSDEDIFEEFVKAKIDKSEPETIKEASTIISALFAMPKMEGDNDNRG